MATIPGHLGSPRGLADARISQALWWIFGLACVFYAILAFDYFLSFAAGREGLWLRLFAALVSEEYAFCAGSVHVDQAVAYADGLDFLLMHTTMGAICMAIGPFQFMHGVRRRFPAAHRSAGRIYLGSVTLSMIGGLAYLGTTPWLTIYSGPAFAVALLGLDLMVLLTAWLAYRAIRQRDVQRHQAWMAFNFGLVLATPGLRLLWIVFGWFVPQFDQAAANLAITTFLLPACLTFMLLWVSAQRRVPAPPR